MAFIFLKLQNTSSICLSIPLHTTYLFSHDSRLPDKTNESQKSLQETFRKARERREQREFRGVLSLKGSVLAASFLWGSSPGVPCPCLGTQLAWGCHRGELPVSRHCPDFPHSTTWF